VGVVPPPVYARATRSRAAAVSTANAMKLHPIRSSRTRADATVVARAPGRTTLSTTLAGRTSTVEVTVVAGGASASTCEPGVFVPTARPFATSPASRRPAEGTLVAVGAGPPTARVEARTLVPLLGRPCAGASVVHVSAAAYLRLLGG
jgi:hypothetical protein